MSEKDFLDKHWTLFVEYVSSLPPLALEQQRQDYILLAAENPETFRSHLKFIDALYQGRKEATAAPPESRFRHAGVGRTRQASSGFSAAAEDSI
jgi:hypothetical protein